MSFRRGKKRKVEIWTTDGKYVDTKESLSDAAEECNVSISSVSYVLSGQRTSANGFIFKETDR